MLLMMERKLLLLPYKSSLLFMMKLNSKGKRFAVIVDEAHSSQTGTSAQKLKQH